MTAIASLPSNRFGRVQQRIIISIPKGQHEKLPDDLEIVPLDDQSSPPRAVYLWRRWSARRGDDEDIVIELSAILGTGEDSPDWRIDWQASEY